MCVLLILYPAMSSIGTPRRAFPGRLRRRFSSSIVRILLIPDVVFSSIPIFSRKYLSRCFVARFSPFMDLDISAKSSMKVTTRITYGIFFPRRVVPCAYRSRIA